MKWQYSKLFTWLTIAAIPVLIYSLNRSRIGPQTEIAQEFDVSSLERELGPYGPHLTVGRFRESFPEWWLTRLFFLQMRTEKCLFRAYVVIDEKDQELILNDKDAIIANDDLIVMFATKECGNAPEIVIWPNQLKSRSFDELYDFHYQNGEGFVETLMSDK